MTFDKIKNLIKKIVSLLSVTRSYNITVVVLAQYLSAIFVFGTHHRALEVLLNRQLFFVVLSSSLAIAGGYIINNFYDWEKDRINRPNKLAIDTKISRESKFKIYFLLNFLSIFIAWLISYRAALFYAFYIFLLWYYSHKLKKYPIIGNLTAALLALLPFWGILFYFKNFNLEIFWFGFSLYLVLIMKELMKDLENLPGDFANGYKTIPVKYGVKKAKVIIAGLMLLQTVIGLFLFTNYDIGLMRYYFYFSAILILIFLIALPICSSKKDYVILHFLIKLWLIAGVFSIILINPKVIINGGKIIDNFV